MARKRMFDSEVINQDAFFDLPMEAKALYFLLGMEADDEGFVSPRKVMRLYGGTDDSIRILAMKNFIIPFESGVIVITDWQNNNWLDTRRVKPTIYQTEKSQLLLNKETKKYKLANVTESKCLADAKQMLRENRIEENRIEENRIEEIKKERKKESKKTFDELIDNYTVNEELREELKNHLKVRKQKKGALTNRAIELSLKNLDKLTKNIPINDVNLQDEEKLKIVRQSILNGWIGFFEVKQNVSYKKDNKTDDGWDYIDKAFKQIQENNNL